MHEFLEQGGQHLLLLLTIVGAALGIWKWMRAEKARRERLLIAAHEQTALLRRIDRELHPKNGDNGGPTVLDVLSGGIERNSRSIATMHADNERAHFDIHRRIDGLFEALGVTNGVRRNMADRHKTERRDDE